MLSSYLLFNNIYITVPYIRLIVDSMEDNSLLLFAGFKKVINYH